MGPLPPNWTQKSFNALTALTRDTLEKAKDNLGEWWNPSPFGTEVRYNPSMVFPPTGVPGCWEIRHRWSPEDAPKSYWRQDFSEAQKTLLDFWGQALSNGSFTSATEAYRFVEDLNLRADIGF